MAMNEADESTDAPDPLQLAIAALGEPISIHDVNSQRTRWLTVIGFGVVIGDIGLLTALVVFAGNLAHSLWHYAMTPMIFGFTLLYRVWRSRGLSIYLFPPGLLRTGQGDVESYLWDEIQSIKLRVDSGTIRGDRDESGQWSAVWFEGKTPLFLTWHSWLEVTRTDGKTLKLSPVFEGYAGLVIAVQKLTFQRMWKEIITRLDAGETVSFGPWSMTNTSLITKKGKVYPFAEWKTPKIANRFLIFGKKKFFSIGGAIDLTTIENPHVFLAALHDRVGGLVTEPKLEPIGQTTQANVDV